jgi:dTDP-4-dehydrorhamnose reductase
MKVLILGATGLLGQHLFIGLKTNNNKVFGTLRDLNKKSYFSTKRQKDLILLKNVFDITELEKIINQLKIDSIINCISIQNIKKQTKHFLDKIYTKFPKELGQLCSIKKIRIVQISTDGVFSGIKGNYTEKDIPDPIDAYGHSKLKGELKDINQITLRLSLIGHDPINKNGLLEWFLNQKQCRAYNKYIFSGLTTNELTRIIRDYIFKKPSLYGLYNVSGYPISKYDLLKLIAKKYNLKTKFIKDGSVKINRALLSTKFYKDTGYKKLAWPKLIDIMKYGKYEL